MTDLSHASWKKSSRSNGTANCVEVAITGEVVGIRNTKDRSGPVLRCAPNEWRAFLGSARDGEFDL